MFHSDGQVMEILEGMDGRRAPLNDWICKLLWPWAQRIISDNNRYTLAFDELEMLMALSSLAHDEIVAPSAFCYQRDRRIFIMEKIEELLSALDNNSPLVICNIFGDTAEQCKQRLGTLKQSISDLRYQ